jgi:hypothetical protein
VFLTLSSACIDTSNAALYCFDSSIAVHLSAKLSSPLITLVAAIRALVAVTKAVLVNANCVSQGAAASVASNALACLCKV